MSTYCGGSTYILDGTSHEELHQVIVEKYFIHHLSIQKEMFFFGGGGDNLVAQYIGNKKKYINKSENYLDFLLDVIMDNLNANLQTLF